MHKIEVVTKSDRKAKKKQTTLRCEFQKTAMRKKVLLLSLLRFGNALSIDQQIGESNREENSTKLASLVLKQGLNATKFDTASESMHDRHHYQNNNQYPLSSPEDYSNGRANGNNPDVNPFEDPELEMKLINGDVNSTDYIADHLFIRDDDDEQDESIVAQRSKQRRRLSAHSARIGTFHRLNCNPQSWSNCDSPVSQIVSNNPDDRLVIPCGRCYTFDIGGNITFNGLDVRGKLLFPINHKAIIHTSFVIVQGELELTVNHAKISPENIATRFVLTGTEDILFTPSDAPNQDACQEYNNQCNLGVKPFFVAGGKVTLTTMPETCATHTPILSKIYKDPTYNPGDFVKFESLPPSCPQSGLKFISYNFNHAGYGNWTGREGSYVVSEDGALRVTNRMLYSRGPYLDITPSRPDSCLQPDQDYLFVSRMKLDMSNNTMIGQLTTCKAHGRHCPEFRFQFHNKEREYSNRKITMHPHSAPNYGEFTFFAGTVTFTEEELSSSNAYFTMLIQGPEPGVDITIDSFDLYLPSEASYADPDAPCEELVHNGNAEGNGFNPYPMVTSRSNERIKVVEENGNKFWRLFDRYDYRSSIKYALDTTCLSRGISYELSSKVRYHNSEGFIGTSIPYDWYIKLKRSSDGKWIDRTIVNCKAQSFQDVWVTCSGEFMVDEDLSDASEAYLLMKINDNRDGGKYDLDYDDISIRYVSGYVSDIVVDSDDISCWGNNADVHVTSATYMSWAPEKTNGFLSKIKQVLPNKDGTSILELSNAAILPIISQEENIDHAIEIALVSRNVIIEASNEEEQKGGYMQILHTPDIVQKIQGIEYINMGRRGEVDRFALQILYSGDVDGTLISRNAFLQSNQRCISIEGSSNITIDRNIGYQSHGHCIYIGYNALSNIVERNLVSDTKHISWSDRLDFETDYHPAAFLSWYPPNDFTHNIAVASERYGFNFESNYRTRLEDNTYTSDSVRKIPLGRFNSNTARSCGSAGIRLTYHESGKKIELDNVRVAKNRYSGLYMYSVKNVTLRNSFFVDNAQYSIEMRWSDNIHIEDTIVQGYRAETKNLVSPPYFNKPCISSSFEPPIGLKLPSAIHRWDEGDNVGAIVTNVTFSNFDHFDECQEAIPMNFGAIDNRHNHFDYLTMFQNVSFDGTRIMDAKSSDEIGIKDIVLNDIGGYSDPLKQGYESGVFVRDVKWLTELASNNCTRYPNGISYCVDTCVRTVSFMVDQTNTENFDLRVTRLSDMKEVLVPFTYKYDGDNHLKLFYENHRFFSLSLPDGSYKVEFLRDLQISWPKFVMPRWGGKPYCQGHVYSENLTIIEPASPCDELIINGQIEQGTAYWYHRNSNADTKYGEIVAVEGQGINASTALRHYNRSNGYAGIGQHLDTSCLHHNLGSFYEIELFFRLENGTIPFICDPFSNSWEVRCPYVTFQQQTYFNEELQSSYVGNRANVIIPNDLGDLNLIHGVFKVDSSLHELDRLFMYVEVAHQDFDLIIDNVSVRRLAGICRGDLIRNGNFKVNGKYWRPYGNAHLDIQFGSGINALKVFNRVNEWEGSYQDLFVDKDCFEELDRFKVTGKFLLESASNGTEYKCDRTMTDGELGCSYIIIRADSALGSENIWSAETVPVVEEKDDGWNLMAGILVMTQKQVEHTRLYARLYGAHLNMNVYYTEISVEPIPRLCENLIVNGDFEVGDTRFWRPSDRRYIDVDVASLGAGNSQYSMSVKKYTGHRLRQPLDTRCLVEGQEYLISADFMYLNGTDLSTGVSCEPSVKNQGDQRHCPTITIRGSNCESEDLEYTFWNEIEQFQWDQSSFNKFERVFVIGQRLGSCKTVMVEIGRYVHNDRMLLVDNIQISQRTTLAPTPYPTFSPTRSKQSGPTTRPTSATFAPSGSTLIECPGIGSSPLILDSGPSMLEFAKESQLCSLVKSFPSTKNGEITNIPIARSYDGTPWRKSPGEYAASLFDMEAIVCYTNSCQLNLPPIESGSVYMLSSTSYRLSSSDEYARFLETATFGISEKLLNDFETSTLGVQDTIASWISNQMNVSLTPATSHREFWRRGLNGRVLASTSIGIANHPCDMYSRWRKISFVRNDNGWNVEKKLRILGEGPFQLELNGWMRTIVQNITIDHVDYENYVFDHSFEYSLCNYPQEIINGRLYIELEDGNCVHIQNPEVNISGYESSVTNIFDLPDGSLQPTDQWWTEGSDLVFQLNISLTNDPSFLEVCSQLPLVTELGDEPIFGKLSNGSWLMYDPRISVKSNTPDSPIIDGGKEIFRISGGETLCSNVPRTFLNEGHCSTSENACKPSSNKQIELNLENETIRVLNILTQRYVYAVKGLLVRYEGIALGHPCTPGLRSRWLLKDISECNPTDLYNNTNATIFSLLVDSGDRNPFIRDIYFPEEGETCDEGDTELEIEIEVNGQCWRRVHDEHLSIFDMTYWVDKHPGGPYNIQKWSENNGTFLIYPSLWERRPHGMASWNNNWQKFTYVGRYGDYIKIGDLPNNLRREEVTNYFDVDADAVDTTQVIVCGSPGEVANHPENEFLFDASNGFQTVGWSTTNNRKYVWMMVALGAKDQIRQRVSWALNQIIVVVTNAIGSQSGKSEWFLNFYDIFVRNAFGNYRDILKETSFNPLMAENLSYLGSKSSAYMLERYRVKTAADENFAREIMQLFSMGLKQLNMDGSLKRDANGHSLLSYTNDDIMSLSRAWTGFDLQPRRGNMEGGDNRLDPMRIVAEWRDRFPKSDTTNGYIGDSYPLCADIPSRSFLKKGARFRFLGSSSLPELMNDPADFLTQSTIERFVLDSSSQLRKALCNPDQNGKCAFHHTVQIPSNLGCFGIECEVDTVRVVQVAVNAFYEFVPAPCVSFSFFNNAKKISPRYNTDPSMCGDPVLPIASESCCLIGNVFAVRNSKYSGERTTYATAEQRCSAVSREVCKSFYRVDGHSYLNSGYFWTSDTCSIRVKIKRDGRIAIVHQPSEFLERVMHVDEDNENFFKVHWGEPRNGYPSVDNACDGVCEVLQEGSCLCNTGVIETAVFQKMPSSISVLRKRLFVGAVDPEVYEPGTYFSFVDPKTNITAFLQNNEFNKETIFKFNDDKSRTFYMKNIKSTVYLRGISTGYTGQYFRNTPGFMSFIPSETNLRDAQFETEATLDHYFYHDNTAPFIASRLLQRLLVSNPSPHHIESVANAFKSGSFTFKEVTFGSKRYGDLAATIAAIYLHSEARSTLLDADLSSGTIREPILKVLAVLRSMDFVSKSPVLAMQGLIDDIGQMAHEFTSVFSFFLSEFKPYGRVGNADLVSPEATLLDGPKVIGLVNGLTSLVKFGLSSCDGGWGYEYCRERRYSKSALGTLQFNITSNEEGFSFDTFEGPSLNGGLDNQWVGRYFGRHNGEVVEDPLLAGNNVLYFQTSAWNAEFFSPIVQNLNGVENLVVKFRYYSTTDRAGGCIGYVDASISSLNSQTWSLCDDYGNDMVSNGQWISCQFLVPPEVMSFRIAVGDRRSSGGDAYFDDIQLGNGTSTYCGDVDIVKFTSLGRSGYSNEIVDRLATLLTAGRLSNESRSVIVEAFDSAGSAQDGLRVAQQLILTSAEFHTTNIVKSTINPREEIQFPKSSGKPYRAVIYLMLSGGCDSFNLLTPHTCNNGLYESYLDVRQQVALAKNRLLPISATNQVCSAFGLHPELPGIKDLYDNEDLLFFANTGVLSQPVNKDNYYVLTNTQLFAHNHMQRETKRIDPYESSSGTGVLGRMTDVLKRDGHNVGSFSVDRFSVALVGKPGESGAPMIVDRHGIGQVHLDEAMDNLSKLHNKTQSDSGIFADLWSSSLMESISTNELLRNELNSLSTNNEFPDTYLGNTLETISKLIATREVRGVDVDTFYIERGGFDTHADVEVALNVLFEEINFAFKSFSQEMIFESIWNNVTLIQTSDFARTLNPNGGDGTDHAWGGNYMMMGGSVKGGQILGEYPESITDVGPLTLSRGRMIPTTPWEAPFRGIASWLGISESSMNEVCPNVHKFNSSYLIDVDEMFSDIPPTPTQAPQLLTDMPSGSPSTIMSSMPSVTSSSHPTVAPLDTTTPLPSVLPSVGPSLAPSKVPSKYPSSMPSSRKYSEPPTLLPSTLIGIATNPPTNEFTSTPSLLPSSGDSSLIPSIEPSLAQSCPLDCEDVTAGKFPIEGVGLRSCAWAIRKPNLKESRCKIPDVAANCCNSCCTLALSSIPSSRESVSASPSISSTNPPSLSPTSISSCPSVFCKGDVTTEKFPIEGVGNRSCDWAIEDADEKDTRCALREVALKCCRSCCTPCIGDAAGNTQFNIPERGIKKKCGWATKKNPSIRCAIDSVARQCCLTCKNALSLSSSSQNAAKRERIREGSPIFREQNKN